MKYKSILYVNYTPYENQGKILDYLIHKFQYIFLISIGHHNIDKKKSTHQLTIYKNGKIIRKQFFMYVPAPSSLVFVFLPLRSIISLFQIVFLAYKMQRKYGDIQYYFTVNGYTAWIGLVLRRLGLVKKTVYWVCDYYPIKHRDKIIQTMRWLYWQFEKHTVSSDRLAFHNTRLIKKWKELRLVIDQSKIRIVPIGTSYEKILRKRFQKKLILCFLGVLKKSQGIDFILDSVDLLQKEYTDITIHIIGPGPDRKYFENKAKKKKISVIFHGYINDEQMDSIIRKCHIGLAPYIPDPTYVSYYGDPGKIKKYISFGLPVIATKIHKFTYEIEKYKAGVLIPYGNKKKFLEAVQTIMYSYTKYQKNVKRLRSHYYYKRLYRKMFDNI